MKPWWNKNWGTDKICSITLTRLRPGKNKKGIKYTTKLKCNHSFCTSAIIKWMKMNSKGDFNGSCPKCRRIYTIEDIQEF